MRRRLMVMLLMLLLVVVREMKAKRLVCAKDVDVCMRLYEERSLQCACMHEFLVVCVVVVI